MQRYPVGGNAHIPAGDDEKLQFHLLLAVDRLSHALIDLVKNDELRPVA